MQKDDTFARYAPKLEKISVDDDRVVVKDNIKNRIAEIAVQNNELYCLLCEEKKLCSCRICIFTPRDLRSFEF